MAVPIGIRIQIVLIMVTFESPVVVKRKIQVVFIIETLDVDCIRDTFQY
jgi:hypothetical protein